jgi:cell division protein FtsN
MGDSRSGYDEDSLPWLQEVEDEDSRGRISGRAMLIGLLLVLLVASGTWATFFWMGRSQSEVAGAPELIRAPAQPYKVKPDDPGGLDIAGSRTTFQTSAGEDVDSRLNTEAPGAPVAVTLPEPKTLPPNETKVPAPAEEAAPKPPAVPSGAPGTVIQLGAFKNVAQAERAWTALKARFGTLSGMTKLIVPYSAGGSSGYRLRAGAGSPDAASAACQAIHAGGESCVIAR